MKKITGETRTIAIVDDEQNIRDTVSFALEREGYATNVYADGLSAWEAFEKKLPELAILDITMPRMDGLDLCKKLKNVSETIPIIFLTSRDDEIDRILGLEIGGDDYLCKPFYMRELLVRIKVLFRRLGMVSVGTEKSENGSVIRGFLTLDTDCYTVMWKDAGIELTVTEFLLLKALVESPGRVKTRNQLIELGYPSNTYVSDRTIDSHIKRIRQKFESIDPVFDCIETVYGLGYRFKAKA
jgi:two-component system response regulator ChvI